MVQNKTAVLDWTTMTWTRKRSEEMLNDDATEVLDQTVTILKETINDDTKEVLDLETMTMLPELIMEKVRLAIMEIAMLKASRMTTAGDPPGQ